MSQLIEERTEKLRAFLGAYQSAVIRFLNEVPDDGFILPKSVVNALGRFEVWPCTDAAVVLSYPSTKLGGEVVLHNQTGQSVELFMSQSDVFSYFDEDGEEGPMRLRFAVPEKDPADPRPSASDFLFDRSSLDDLIAWPPTEGDGVGLSGGFFAPKFTRISIFGWNSFLGSPTEEAVKDLRRGYAAHNLLTCPPFTTGFLEALFEAGAKCTSQLETVLDQNNPESLREFVTDHPEVVRPDYVRTYLNVTVRDRVVDLVLLIPGEQSLEYLFVTFGDPKKPYFTEANEPSDSHTRAKDALAVIRDSVTSDPQRIGLAGDFADSSFVHVSSRTPLLNYAQKKSLYEQGGESHCRFETYDDLLNKLRYHMSDITGIRDRFLPIESRLSRLGVGSDHEFDDLMQQIDREMQTEKIPLTARAFEGVLRLSSVYSLFLLNRDPLCEKVNDWFDRWYGDRAKMIMGLGSMGVILRGDVLRMDFPIGFGMNRVICTRELTKERPSVIIGTRDNPPTLNALDFVQGLTQEFANTLSQDELQGLFNQFVFGRTAFMRIFEVFEGSELTKLARADLTAAASHLFESHPNYALSKWGSLQASEKFIKDFISRKGGTAPKSHKIKHLATIAEQHGLPPIPEQWLDDIECSAEVRYGGIPVTAQEAVEAQYAALQVCEHIATH